MQVEVERLERRRDAFLAARGRLQGASYLDPAPAAECAAALNAYSAEVRRFERLLAARWYQLPWLPALQEHRAVVALALQAGYLAGATHSADVPPGAARARGRGAA